MITVIESQAGIRLNYNGLEVFNHSEVFPFVKFIKGSVVYGVKKGALTASYDTDGEYAATEYKVLSAGAKSANIQFLGYGGLSVKINCVEEKERLVLYFSPEADANGLKLCFLSNAFETIMLNDADIKGKKADNLLPVAATCGEAIKGTAARLMGRADNALSRKAQYAVPLTVISDKGLSYTFDAGGYICYDLRVKTMSNYYFAACPRALIVKADDSVQKAISDKIKV